MDTPRAIHPRGPRSVLESRTRLWSYGGHGAGGRRTYKLERERALNYRALRAIAGRAWLINLLILHLQRQALPFLKPTTDENRRGFQIRLKGGERMREADKRRARDLETFLLNCGWEQDPNREKLTAYIQKSIRDVMTIDAIATEIQRTRGGDVFAFWAVDPATITRVREEGYEGSDSIRFIQEVDLIETARYSADDLFYDYMTPRTDIDFSGYGYSYVEQAVDLVISFLHSFHYNAASMTEDNLPRGMLLLNGDADMETVEQMTEYLTDIMSAGPAAKWRIPIIPSGSPDGTETGRRGLEWVRFDQSNRDAEYSQWMDRLTVAVCALFGVDPVEIGIAPKTSGLFHNGDSERIEESKARGLSTILGFHEAHLQRIIDATDDRFDLEFLGYEKTDRKAEMDVLESELRTYRTIDEIRTEKGLQPFNTKWSSMPLNGHTAAMERPELQGYGFPFGKSIRKTKGREILI